MLTQDQVKALISRGQEQEAASSVRSLCYPGMRQTTPLASMC